MNYMKTLLLNVLGILFVEAFLAFTLFALLKN